MFGGLCFMVNDKMCIGVETNRLMVRLDPSKMEEVLEKEGCKLIDFTGKVMIGFVFVEIDAERGSFHNNFYLKNNHTLF